jgi:hypothetical protein
MIPTGNEWQFPHGFLIVEEHTGYELTCNGAFVSYNKKVEPLLDFLKIQLGASDLTMSGIILRKGSFPLD